MYEYLTPEYLRSRPTSELHQLHTERYSELACYDKDITEWFIDGCDLKALDDLREERDNALVVVRSIESVLGEI